MVLFKIQVSNCIKIKYKWGSIIKINIEIWFFQKVEKSLIKILKLIEVKKLRTNT